MIRLGLPILCLMAIQAVVRPLWSWPLLVVLVASMVLHELGHVAVAFAYGDETARRAGRFTLNPLVHLGSFGFAPVPVDFRRIGRQAAIAVLLAGPAVNFALAFWMTAAPRYSFWWTAGMVNLVVGAFNLVPMPPLDGDKVLQLLAFREIR